MKKIDILLIGSTHLNMPQNGDALMPDMPDVLSDRRQHELVDFVEKLATFRPTKVCLEVSASSQQDLSDRYQKYKNSSYTKTADEREQIGFRLAERCRLEQVHAIDWNENEGYGLESTLEAYPKEMTQILDAQQAIMKQIEMLYQEQSITSFYESINDATYSKRMHQAYLEIASLDDAATRWVTNYWYYRNVRIVREVMRLREEEDRIVILYGLGHVHLLRQLLLESGTCIIHELNVMLSD